MKARTSDSIIAEIEALQARIRRLRLERRVAALAAAEKRLLQIADRDEGEHGGSDESEGAG